MKTLSETIKDFHYRSLLIAQDGHGRPIFVGPAGFPCSFEDLQELRPAILSALKRTRKEIRIEYERLEEKEEVHYANARSRQAEQNKPLPRMGFIYLIKNNRNGFVKIGFSRVPKIRESTLQSEEPDISMFWKFFGSMDDERKIHHRFTQRGQWIRGEWFRLSEADVESIKRKFGGEAVNISLQK